MTTLNSEVTNINKTQKKDVLYIDPRIIRIVDGFNTRVDFGDIDGLKNSIIENGVEKPLSGYKEGDFYYLTDGQRRLTATMLAIEEGNYIARVPFISGRKKTIEERILDILISNDGKPLTSLELGETYKKLVSYGLSITEIAKRTGKTYKHVTDMVNVAGNSTEVKTMIQDGKISATTVAEVNANVKNIDEAEAIIKEAVSKTEGKVTKKDVQKVTNKIIQTTFTLDEVITLLQQQRDLCAESVTLDIDRELVLKTKLVIAPKIKRNVVA